MLRGEGNHGNALAAAITTSRLQSSVRLDEELWSGLCFCNQNIRLFQQTHKRIFFAKHFNLLCDLFFSVFSGLALPFPYFNTIYQKEKQEYCM